MRAARTRKGATTAVPPLLAAVLRAVDGGVVPPLGSDEWAQVVADAQRVDVAPAIGFAVARGTLGHPPPAVAASLGRALVEATARHLALMRGLASVLDALAGARVPALPLKGPVLAETLYPHPAFRTSTDLDILVPAERRGIADATLAGLGYRPTTVDRHDRTFDLAYDAALAYDGPGGIRVDLHWRLVTEPAFRWNEPASRAVWARARRVRVGGIDTLALAPEDLLLYLAAHLASHHGFAGARWQWDVARVVGGAAGPVDWRLAVARARQWQVGRALHTTLAEVVRTFAIAVPTTVMHELRPRGPRSAALARLLARADEAQRGELEHLIAVLAIDRGAGAAATVTRAVWPSSAWLAARYPGRSRAGRYRAHGGRLAVVAVGTARALLRRGRPAAALP